MVKQTYHITTYLPPWKVFLLGAATLGIYAFIWASLRYAESVDTTKWYNHWATATWAIFITLLLLFVLSTGAPFLIADPAAAAQIAVYGSCVIVAVLLIGLTYWLVWHVRQVTRSWEIHMSLIAAIIMGGLFPPSLTAYAQHRLNTDTDREVIWQSASTVVSVVIGGLIVWFGVDVYAIDRQIDTLRSEYETMRQYIDCQQKVQSDYEGDKLTEDNYDEYQLDYAECDDVFR